MLNPQATRIVKLCPQKLENTRIKIDFATFFLVSSPHMHYDTVLNNMITYSGFPLDP